MSNFSDIYRLSIPVSQDKNVEIEKTDAHKTIVLTIDKKHVVVFNVHDQQLITDWTVGGKQLSSPAVLYGDPPQLSVILGDNTVCTWKESDIRIEKGHKQTIAVPICGLWVPFGQSCPYIIHSSGAVSSLDDSSENIIPEQLSSEYNLVWRGHVREEECNILCSVCQDKDTKTTTCLVYEWQRDSNTVTCTKHDISRNDGEHYTSYSICHHVTGIYVFLLDSSFMLRRLCVSGNNNTGHLDCLHKIPNISKTVVISALDDHQVAVVGMSGPDDTAGVAIWDTRFGLMQSFKDLKKSNPHSVYMINRRLYLPCSDGVYVCNYTPNTGTLGAAMGALKSSSVDVISAGHDESTLDDDLVEIRQMLYKLADSNEKPSSKSFNLTVTSCAEWLSTASPEHLDVLAPDINLLVQRLSQPSFSPADRILQVLLDSHVIQASHLELLLPGLIEHKKSELICLAMNQVSYIPEIVLLQALAYFIRTLPKESEMETEDGDVDEHTDYTRCMYKEADNLYINSVLRLPFNEVFLVEAVKHMEFSLVMDLLKYLLYLLPWVPAATELANVKGVPVLSQVFDWCSMCLDAHLSQIMISTDAKPVIFELAEQMKHQMSFYEELGCLDSVLKQLKEKWTQKPKHGAKHYCIQTLNVP